MSENQQAKQAPAQSLEAEVPADGAQRCGQGLTQRFYEDPWAQAGVAGVLMLVPARKYPGWLRQGLTWGSTAATTAVALVPGATTTLLKLSARHFGTEGQELSEVPEPGPVFRTAAALGVGALMYGSWRVSFWADDSVERGLRRLHVPAPRLAMAAGMAAVTWYQVDQDNRRARRRPEESEAAVECWQEAETPSGGSVLREPPRSPKEPSHG